VVGGQLLLDSICHCVHCRPTLNSDRIIKQIDKVSESNLISITYCIMDSDFFPLNTFTALELDIFDNF